MSISDTGKLILGYTGLGVTFAILFTLSVTLINAMIGLQFPSSVGGIVTGLFSGDVSAILTTAISVILVGVFVWIFGYLGAIVKSKISGGGKLKLQTRPHVVGFFVTAIIAIGIFSVVDEMLASAGTSTDPTMLLTNVAEFNFIGVIAQIFAYAILGFVVAWIGSKFQAFEKPIPDALKKF